MQNMKKTGGAAGFTLVELLVIIGIIGFLAAAILVAVDPLKRLQDARDARRYAETYGILNAMLAKQAADKALYDGEAGAPILTQTGTNVQVIVTDDTGIVCNSAAARPGCDKPMDTSGADKNCVADLSALVPSYIAAIPTDPAGGKPCAAGGACTTYGDLAIGPSNSGYYIARSKDGRIEIGACKAEPATHISVKR